jgi:transaldolase
LDIDLSHAERILVKTAETGLDLDAITASLEREGVRSFCSSYRELLDCIGSKLAALAGSQRA